MKIKQMALLLGGLVALLLSVLASFLLMRSGLPNPGEIVGIAAYAMLGVAALCFGLNALLYVRRTGVAPRHTAALPMVMLTIALGVVHIGGEGQAVQITHYAAIAAALIVTIFTAYIAVTRRT